MTSRYFGHIPNNKVMTKVSFSPLHITEAFKMLITTSQKGAEMATHISDKDAVLFVVSGNVEFLLDTVPTKLSSNESILIPGGVRHSFSTVEDSTCILTLDATAKIRFEKQS